MSLTIAARDLNIYHAPLVGWNSQSSTWVRTIIPGITKLVTKYCMFVGTTREIIGLSAVQERKLYEFSVLKETDGLVTSSPCDAAIKNRLQ